MLSVFAIAIIFLRLRLLRWDRSHFATIALSLLWSKSPRRDKYNATAIAISSPGSQIQTLRSRILFFQIALRSQSSCNHDHQGEIIITSLWLRFHHQGCNPDLGIADTTFQNCVAIAIIFLQSRSSHWGCYNFAAITISTLRSCRYSKRDLLQLHRYYWYRAAITIIASLWRERLI